MRRGLTSASESDRDPGQDGAPHHDQHDPHVVAVGNPPARPDCGDEESSGHQLGARRVHSCSDRPHQESDRPHGPEAVDDGCPQRRLPSRTALRRSQTPLQAPLCVPPRSPRRERRWRRTTMTSPGVLRWPSTPRSPRQRGLSSSRRGGGRVVEHVRSPARSRSRQVARVRWAGAAAPGDGEARSSIAGSPRGSGPATHSDPGRQRTSPRRGSGSGSGAGTTRCPRPAVAARPGRRRGPPRRVACRRAPRPAHAPCGRGAKRAAHCEQRGRVPPAWWSRTAAPVGPALPARSPHRPGPPHLAPPRHRTSSAAT